MSSSERTYERKYKIDDILHKQNKDNKIHFACPGITGCYSVDRHRNFCNDLSQLRYFKHPVGKFRLDLNTGFSSFRKKLDFVKEEKINHILQFILNNLVKLIATEEQKTLKYDFVCFRGLLTKIMISPFCKENWTVCAIKYRGTIYLCACDLEEEKTYFNKERFDYYGYSFENHVFSSSWDLPPDVEKTVDASEEFCLMFNSKLNGKSILYGAEVDGVLDDKVVDSSSIRDVKFVEVKTSKVVETKNQDISLKRKMLKWFSQSYLVGIENVFVGFRDDDGIVEKIDKIPVLKMPKIAGRLWQYDACLYFLNEFLEIVRYSVKNFTKTDEIMKFEYNWKNRQLNVVKEDDVQQYKFLPEWYIREIDKCKNTV